MGDGTEGLAESSPFDAILVAAVFPAVPPPLVTQLAADGRLVMPMGPGGQDTVAQFVKAGDRLLRTRDVVLAHFVRLVEVPLPTVPSTSLARCAVPRTRRTGRDSDI